MADIPPVFNVTLLRRDIPIENRRLLYSSKGVGEPPYMSGVSTYFSIKMAVKAAREERGLTNVFKLGTPATPSNIMEAINSD